MTALAPLRRPCARRAGIPLKWTTTGFVKPGAAGGSGSNPIPPSVVHYSALIGDLTHKAQDTAKRLLGEGEGEVALLRLRTRTGEVIIAPSPEATLVVLQRAHSAVMVPLVAAAETGAGGAAAAGGAGGPPGTAGGAGGGGAGAEEKKTAT
jgi:hypothetical protein